MSEGAVLLDALREAIVRHVVMPSSQAADAVTLWVACTHALPAFDHAPRLVIRSPEKRCGKSRLLDVLAATCHRPLVTIDATAAAIFRSIAAEHPPTLLVDEVDAIFGTKTQAERHEDLRALLNAGHQRGRPALRCVGPQQTPQEFNTFAMAALAGIGDLPDTITDRAVVVSMRRRRPDEQVAPWRHRRDSDGLADMRDSLNSWLGEADDELRLAQPDMPVEDRAADTWEPLVAVADLAGGEWSRRSRTAAVVLSEQVAADDVETSVKLRLLADCRDVFVGLTAPQLRSEDLVDELRRIAEAPWEAFAYDQRKLARDLRTYGVKPTRIRLDDGHQVRGYRLEDFADAFARYLPDAPSQDVTTSQPQVSPVTPAEPVTVRPVTDAQTVTALTWRNDSETDCDAPCGADGDGRPLKLSNPQCGRCGRPNLYHPHSIALGVCAACQRMSA